MRTIVAGAAAGAVSLVLAIAIFEVRPGDLAVPIWYGGDSFFTLSLVKGLLAYGTILHNPDVGAPQGLDFHDFPYPYDLHLAVLRGIGLFTNEPGAAVNVLWLLGFPAIAVAAFAALRTFELPRAESAAAAVLYSFLPYHLWRGEMHLFLSMYYIVPLAAALAVRLYEQAPQLAMGRGAGLRIPARTAWIAAAIALALGVSGAYYAFFGCFFFALAGALGAIRTRRLAPFLAGLALVGTVCASALVGVAPSLLHWSEHGRNREVAQRHASDAEVFGLKIAQMLLSVPEHRVDSWAAERSRYSRSSPLVNENESASVGLVTGAGFLLLVGWALTAPGRRQGTRLLDGLAALHLGGLLLATIGGFGSLVASLLDFRAIRAYNRMSIWLAFFALAALVAVAQPLRGRLLRTRLGARAGALGLVLLLALALVDVVSPAYVPDRAATRRAFATDRAFVTAAEATLPPGTIVFQLPHVPYPEEPPPGRTGPYDSLRPYLHARTLRWSHGAMRGRPADDVIEALAALAPEQMVAALPAAGYGAVLVDRFAYGPDASVEEALTAQFGPAALTSDDARFALFRTPSADLAP